MHEIAWIGSIVGIGGLVGTVVVGWIADRIGRKNSLLAMAVPQIVSEFKVKINYLNQRLNMYCNVSLLLSIAHRSVIY